MFGSWIAGLLLATPLFAAAPYEVRLPTANDFLYKDQPEKFYMHVDRTFEGQVSKAWEGGCFGFVRTPIRINGEVVMVKFHEGIDIAPMERDKAGNPLDPVNSIADGKVVHISPVAGMSNYGRYVVVEHQWDGSPIYSIYAHLTSINVKEGDPVKLGDKLGQMGFTGAGIDRVRSHVHLEITLMLSERFDDWTKAIKGAENKHGNFNGMNFAGADAAKWFLERRKNPELKFSDFVYSQPVQFKVTVPGNGILAFGKRYPWLLRGDESLATSWEISFTNTGLPIAVTASERSVTTPIVTYLRSSTIPQTYLTRGLVNGSGATASLTSNGKQLIALLTGDFPVPPAAPAKPASTPPVTSKPKPLPPGKPAVPAKPTTPPAKPTRTR